MVLHVYILKSPIIKCIVMRVTVCVPSGWLVKADPLFRIFQFVNSAVKHDVYFYMAISNRVDLNRSTCVDVAKSRNEALIMVDSDVIPLQPFDEVMDYLKEDEGDADVVVGVIASSLGVLVNPYVPGAEKFPVEYGSLGFVYLPRKTLKKLPLLGWYKYSESLQYPLYFRYTLESSEDSDFIIRVRGQGMKVIADTRVRLVHVKDVKLEVKRDGQVNASLR